MNALTFYKWTPAFESGFTAQQFQAFQTVIQTSPLLVDLLNNFGGTIDSSNFEIEFNPGTNTISVAGPDLPLGSNSRSLYQIAASIGHELGHALMPDGHSDVLTASSVAQAIQIGITEEGIAAATAFIVAYELSRQPGAPSLQSIVSFPPSLITSLTNALINAGGDASVDSLGLLQNNAAYLQIAIPAAAAWYATQRPSVAGLDLPGLNASADSPLAFTYENYYGDGWVLQNLFKVSADAVDWTKMSPASLQITLQGYTGSNIPIAPGVFITTGLQGYKTVAGETLSFSGATEAGARGVDTLAAGLSATVVGGLGSSDVLIGRPGTDTFEVDLPSTPPAGYAATIVANPSGQGQIYIYSQEILCSATLTETSLDHWTDGTFSYRFIPWSQIPGADLQGIPPSAFSLFNVDGSSGELVITGGPSGATINVVGFNLQQAESLTGFLGIFIPPALSISIGGSGPGQISANFQAGSDSSFSLSVDASSDVSRTVAIALSGSIPVTAFGVNTANGIVPLNSSGTFDVTIPAGQTTVSFSLMNVADVEVNGTLQLNASMPDTAAPSGKITSGILTLNYVQPSNDPFAQPTTSTLYNDGPDSYNGTQFVLYDQHGGQTEVGTPVSSAGSGNNFITVSGVANDSIQGGNGNDTIYANFGAGIANGGTDVIEGEGGQDVLYASNYIATSGGTGPASVRIYAGSAVSLQTAIQNANANNATGLQGDLIVSQVANATIVGSAGNDLILDGGDDLVVAGPGDETIVGGATAANVSPPNGYDADLSNPDEILPGVTWSMSNQNGDLSLTGGLAIVSDTTTPPTGSEGNYDYLGDALGATNSTIYGGSGNDVIELSNGNNDVELGTGNSTVQGGMGSNTIIGGDGNNALYGGGGSDYITAGDGNSVLAGFGGNNTLIGGTGNDTLYAGSNFDAWASAETGDNYVQAGSGNTTIWGSGGNDTLIGGSGNDVIQAGDGNESIVGGSGTESINGGSGNDTIDVGGDGSDTVYGKRHSEYCMVVRR